MVLNDGISGVLRKINTALNTTLNAFEQVQRASGRAVDTAQIQAARAALVQANREVDEMAEGYRRAAEQEEILNKGLRNGTNAAGGLLGKVKGIVATLAAGAGIKALLGLSDKMTSTTASRPNAVRVFPVPEIALKQISAGVVNRYAAHSTQSEDTEPSIIPGMSVYMLITVLGNMQKKTSRGITGT